MAKAIGIEQPSLVRILDQLEEKELINRHTCVNYRQVKRVKLIEQSMKLINEVDGIIEKTRNEILGDITHDELIYFIH